ncbi:MAG: flagellar protein [Lachnospiraceae bacterium]|nr:flagellar protein [Lachnospiraceae bacterium]
MNIRNCRNCGRIFNYVAGAILCQPCRELMEKKFQEVKEYIRQHPGVGIAEVSEACDVDPAQIRQWLREERLEVTENSAIFLNCESCGAPIRTGRFCEKCKCSMTRDFKEAVAEKKPAEPPKAPQTKTKERMRFL